MWLFLNAILSLFVASSHLAGTRAAATAMATATINAISATGAPLGTVIFTDSAEGLLMTPKLSGLPPEAVTAPHLTMAEIRGRSVMIHAGVDNYSDTPAPLGGGGARIACGVIK